MAAKKWSERELMTVLGVYFRLTFGQLNQTNSLIQQVAGRLERTPGSVAMKLSNIASLDPAITGTGRKGLSGASSLDRKVWAEFSSNTDKWMPIIEASLQQLLLGEASQELNQPDERIDADFTGINVEAVVKRRQGQSLFRDAVFTAYQSRCCITGIADTRLLIASHIKPWRTDEKNRLNPRNGLCLSALADRAFDQGMISLTDNYEILVSTTLKTQSDNKHIHDTFCSNEGLKIRLPEKFLPEVEFLDWHRENLFLG